jgi:D-inositol-3-phosphate glycosyltransferase
VPGRRALPALALTADAAVLTAWSNDAGYEDAFARQVEAFGRSGDVLVGLSTSGHSRNVIQAFRTAERLGLCRLAILGGDCGDLRHLANVSIVVPTSDTQRIQEVHTLIVHLICELVEQQLVLGSTVAHSPSAAEPVAIWAPALQRL